MKKLISFVLALVLMLSLVPSAFAASKPQVQLTTSNIIVNGKTWTGLEVYNIDGNNYFKLRDIAYLLKGTDSHIGVKWVVGGIYPNGIVDISWMDYEPIGGECEFDGVDKSASAVKVTQEFRLEKPFSTKVQFDAYNIAGNNFVKLRDIIEDYTTATVDWDGSTNSVIITTIEKQGTLEEQRAYREECFRLEWSHDAMGGGTLIEPIIAKYNELLSSGKIRLDMSVSELEQAINSWLDTIPNQNKVFSGFYTPGIGGHVKSVLIDGSALNNNSISYTHTALMDYIYVETGREDIKAAGYWNSNYGVAYKHEYYGY